MKNCHMLPYLDNEFLEVARTSEDSLKKIKIKIKIKKEEKNTNLLYCLTSSQVWLMPLVEACQSSYLTKWRKQNKKTPLKLINMAKRKKPALNSSRPFYFI